MTILKSFWFRLVISLMGALIVNLAVLFTIPPTTTFGMIVKDVVSLIIAGIIYFKILKREVC